MTPTRVFFREPDGNRALVGELREVAGETGFINDQRGGRTDTWVRRYDAPMAFSVEAIDWARKQGATLIVAASNDGVFMTTMEHMRNNAKRSSLGCEEQYFLAGPNWDGGLRWKDLQLKYHRVYEVHYIDVPEGTFTQRRKAA